MTATQAEKLREKYAKKERRYREERYEPFLARRRAIWERYAAKPENQVKIKARNKIKHLCRTGKVQRGDCEVCGTPNGEAHHEDYSKPLDVRWLCRKCHHDEHH